MQNLNPSIRPFQHQVQMPVAVHIMQQHALDRTRSRIGPRSRQQSIRRPKKNIHRPARLNHQIRMPIAVQVGRHHRPDVLQLRPHQPYQRAAAVGGQRQQGRIRDILDQHIQVSGIVQLRAHHIAEVRRIRTHNCKCPEFLRRRKRTIAVAVRDMGFTPAEAVWSATAGGAKALRRNDVGVLAIGRRADFIRLDAPSYIHLAYRPGVPIVADVVRAGR